ncbi:hypothetical protein DFH11DRAFT_1877406 [Phellopilus nigrolimitatus]|nr:hypothetical protein DFH11DRAFT_1877406 [Phellopilus nigrolimitatus]
MGFMSSAKKPDISTPYDPMHLTHASTGELPACRTSGSCCCMTRTEQENHARPRRGNHERRPRPDMMTVKPSAGPLPLVSPPTNGALPPADGPAPPTLAAPASTFDAAAQLFDADFAERVARFAAEDGGPLYVVKMKDEVEVDARPTHNYRITASPMYSPAHVTTIALVKRGVALDMLVPLAQQQHFINLFSGDETPYERLQSLASGAVKC